ncbi:MAG: hypothetical protein IH921_04730, partial [Gemmatimonadetes bacterium]|nr:hypothetical protein [Gemmatimonadota bacterium]
MAHLENRATGCGFSDAAGWIGNTKYAASPFGVEANCPGEQRAHQQGTQEDENTILEYTKLGRLIRRWRVGIEREVEARLEQGFRTFKIKIGKEVEPEMQYLGLVHG